MKHHELNTIKQQEAQCRPGGELANWELCFRNLRLCLRHIEVLEGEMRMLAGANLPWGSERATLLGWQERVHKVLNGEIS